MSLTKRSSNANVTGDQTQRFLVHLSKSHVSECCSTNYVRAITSVYSKAKYFLYSLSIFVSENVGTFC